MSYSDEEIKRAADVKMWLDSRIGELKSELEQLEQTRVLVDTILRKSSFVSASTLTPAINEGIGGTTEVSEQFHETRDLKNSKDGSILATADISSGSITIVPAENLALRPSTPPFKSFFINRILEGMRGRDAELFDQHKITKPEMLTYEIEEKNGEISKIIINNYRDSSRLKELLNSATWVFSRMVEKKQ
jgi:hypothetical protein